MIHQSLNIKHLLVLCVLGWSHGPAAQEFNWIKKSNEYTKIVLDGLARYEPERAGSLGVAGFDVEITDLRRGTYERRRRDFEKVLSQLNLFIAAEKNNKVRQDLVILRNFTLQDLRSRKLHRDLLIPYYHASQRIFDGIRTLLDPQVSRSRYPAALVRLKRYAGLADGFSPITELAKTQIRMEINVKGKTWPYRLEVEQDIKRSETFITGLKELFEGSNLAGWQEPFTVLAGQLREYTRWLKSEILPRTRSSHLVAEELYRDELLKAGVAATPEELMQQAIVGYLEIRNEMDVLGGLVAKQKGYKTEDYRQVIRRLRDEGSIAGDRLLAHYEDTLKKLEAYIMAKNLIGLPEREAGIRIASAAETASLPAPHLDVPRLVGNTGERPFFVIPNINQNVDGSWPHTDYNFEAGAWTLTAHEARPGHELQFSQMIEDGVSLARVIFAFNSVNVEGWALYAESIAKPGMPLEGQLISLQYRLLRAARMFLDPMLNLGLMTPAEAKNMLIKDVVIDPARAQDEIERYTYRSPGQATAYYYGYLKMQYLRMHTELVLRKRFDQRAFHEFVLAQGMLPPELLKQVVVDEFIAKRLKVEAR